MKEEIQELHEYLTRRAELFARAALRGMTVEEYLRHRARIRRARTIAERAGLESIRPILWLLDAQKNERVDPRAFAHAERALGTDCWERILPSFVAAAWRAAGCRPTGKFFAQLRRGHVAYKGESEAQYIAWTRGFRWLMQWEYVYWRWPVSLQALRALGRLSPELRHAAARGVLNSEASEGRRPVRLCDLNWAEVARIQRLRNDPSREALLERARVLPARPAWLVLGLPDPGPKPRHPIHNGASDLCPEYPFVSWQIAAAIRSGRSPSQICEGLTKKEAHQYLLSGGPPHKNPPYDGDIIDWLIRGLPEYPPVLPRSIAVARWLVHVNERGAWAALVRERRLPDGRTVRLLDITDEVMDQDLDRGPATGVERAFANAFSRMKAEYEADQANPLCNNPFPCLPAGARLLRTTSELKREGAEMDHCVSGYTTAIAAGHCYILAMQDKAGRSTVELRKGGRGWEVAQHKGRSNGAPPPAHVRTLRQWLARINQRRVI